MLNKPKTAVFIILIIIILISGWYGYHCYQKAKEKKFLSQLKGKVVFTDFDEQSKTFAIWTINADGTDRKMIYHHTLGVPGAGCMYPEWSKDGSKIYFLAVDQNKNLRIFQIDEDGKNPRLAENPSEYSNPEGGRRWSREEDLVVKKGSVFYRDENGQEKEIYHFSGHYQIDTRPGAAEVSWSPDKKYIIFELNFNEIMIADLNGNVAKLTHGNEPDWKY